MALNIQVPLSSKGVKSVRRVLRNLKETIIHDDGFDESLRGIAADILANALRQEVNTLIFDPDGNMTGDVSIKHVAGLSEIKWSGDQILFLEFGTGVEGIDIPYPDPSIMALVGYEPQLYHGDEMYWVYKDRVSNEYIKTFGIPAYAPMYTVFLDAENILHNGGFREKVSNLFSDVIGKAFADV